MANPSIFPGSTKSTWSYTKDGVSLGTVYLFTSDVASRVELVNPPDANVVMIGRDGKVWVRRQERDEDMSTIRYTGLNFRTRCFRRSSSRTPPHTTKPDDKIELLKGQLYNYWYRFGQAGYSKDADSRPRKVEVLGHQMTFILERLSLEVKEHDPAIFNVRT